MAAKVTIGGSGALFVGEDKVIDVEVLDGDDLPVNIAAFTMLFTVKRNVTDLDVNALLNVVPTVTGVYSATRAANTQRARITLSDSDMSASRFSALTYQYSLKRTDDGFETVIAYGPFVVEQATQA